MAENDPYLHDDLHCETKYFYQNLANNEKIIDFHIYLSFTQILNCNF